VKRSGCRSLFLIFKETNFIGTGSVKVKLIVIKCFQNTDSIKAYRLMKLLEANGK
jgi:hypothetical protein